jgi:hypothetical protein
MTRICTCVKDVQIVTGKSERYARILLATIKNKLGKSKEQVVTIKELCDHLGLDEYEVRPLLK